MGFLKLKTVCCCMPLRTGVIVVGWLSLVFRALAMLMFLVLCIIATYNVKPSSSAYYNHASVQAFIILLVIGFTLGFLAIPICLLYGIYKKRPNFMIPTLGEIVTSLVPIPAILISSLALLAIAPVATLLIIITSCIYGGFGLYYLRIIWSYHEVLRAEVDAEANSHTMGLRKPAEDHVYPSGPPAISSKTPPYSSSYDKL